ncbi:MULTISPECIES: winged helix-turn-helix domain-containing protein [Sulfolobaceae]|uniref:winged helix-turn-helix domain-containing protein n=1 Tax=Sulfolobaceae TaxID=118883 RepID=UPI00163D732E|nr:MULTISPECIES: winged helix-turn-helix domain-containing protein [unclassified Sulfolobus]
MSNMGIRRERIEIIYIILNGCKEGSKKTKLMYSSGLNYQVFMRYISELENLGLIKFENGSYFLTEKGEKTLELITEYMKTRNRLMEMRRYLSELLKS